MVREWKQQQYGDVTRHRPARHGARAAGQRDSPARYASAVVAAPWRVIRPDLVVSFRVFVYPPERRAVRWPPRSGGAVFILIARVAFVRLSPLQPGTHHGTPGPKETPYPRGLTIHPSLARMGNGRAPPDRVAQRRSERGTATRFVMARRPNGRSRVDTRCRGAGKATARTMASAVGQSCRPGVSALSLFAIRSNDE